MIKMRSNGYKRGWDEICLGTCLCFQDSEAPHGEEGYVAVLPVSQRGSLLPADQYQERFEKRCTILYAKDTQREIFSCFLRNRGLLPVKLKNNKES